MHGLAEVRCEDDAAAQMAARVAGFIVESRHGRGFVASYFSACPGSVSDVEIRRLSREDFLASVKDLRNSRIDLAQRIDHDQGLFHRLQGDTFGAMCDSAELGVQQEKRTGALWHGGQAVVTLGGGYLALSSLSMWMKGTSAVPMLIHDPLISFGVGAALIGVSYYCRNQVEQSRYREEQAVDNCTRMHSWTWALQEADQRAKELAASSRTEVQNLATSLQGVNSSILLGDKSLVVGGVQLKRRGATAADAAPSA